MLHFLSKALTAKLLRASEQSENHKVSPAQPSCSTPIAKMPKPLTKISEQIVFTLMLTLSEKKIDKKNKKNYIKV